MRADGWGLRIGRSIALALAVPGCLEADDPGAVTVATARGDSERQDIEEAFRSATNGSGRIHWVALASGDDVPSVTRRRHPPDVLLSSSAAPFNDPRRDPFTLARAKVRLAGGPWAEAYAGFVRDRGVSGPSRCVAIPGVERPRDEAREFLTYLEATGRADTRPPDAADGLLADLLGAVLVDARDELNSALEALERAGNPEKATRWMTEAPPWPPASVARMLARESNAMPMVETLAAQLAPDADVRAWLLRSWLTPAHAVDGEWLGELAHAADGKLANEPRFRAWLRGEWTAWARQRFRRVARTAAEATGR